MTDSKFSHISVTPADEEEVVIFAGVQPAAKPEQPAVSTPAAKPEQPAASAPSKPEQPAASAPADAASAPKPATKSESKQAKKKRKGSYRETTLEDLKESKMPGKQKAIIAVAFLLIVVAVVYYCFIK